MSRYASYIICATPRSGSTLLCRLLTATGVAGKPDSYFHLASVASWSEDLDLSCSEVTPDTDVLRGIVGEIQTVGRNGTDLFGLRLMRMSFAFLMSQLDRLYPGRASDAERFEAAFGPTLYIHLSRGDKVEQAVSRVKAEQTGLWHRWADGTELERLAPPAPPAYDAERISRQIDALVRYDADWTRWFEAQGIVPVRITYEELSSAPSDGVARILRHLELDTAPAQGLVPEVAKLADETSQAWVARYKAEHPEYGAKDSRGQT